MNDLAERNVPIAVTSRSFSRHAVLRAELQARYDDVKFNDAGVSLEGSALIEFLRGRTKAITALERVDDALFEALPELRVIGKYGVGVDMIDLPAMQRHGVRLGWRGGVNRRSVAELVIAAAIDLLHRVPEGNALVRGGGWRQIVGRQLSGKTVGIVGCGHIGKDVVLLLKPFGCRVLANDIRNYDDFYAAHGVVSVALDRLVEESDVITLHVPLDESTRGIMSRERIARMKDGGILINVARGGLVDELAVAEALMNKELGGVAFDVFTQEPPAGSDLIGHPNFIATPHIGGSTEEAILAMGRAAIEGLESAVLPFEIAEIAESLVQP